MNDPQPSLGDLKSIIEAAEKESAKLKEPVFIESVKNHESTNNSTSPASPPSLTQLPTTPQNLEPNKMKEILSNTNIGTMLGHMADNPNEVSKVMESSIGNNLPPDITNQARKLAMGGQGEQIMREMQKRGMDPVAMKKQFLQEQRKAKGQPTKSTDITKQIIYITTSRQVKTRKIVPDGLKAAVSSILHTENPVELSCSRLAQGPLSGKTIKAWYNPDALGKNRRASKIVGFNIGSELVIVLDGGDLKESDFIAAEKQLE